MHLVIKGFILTFDALKRVGMNGSFLNKAAPPPARKSFPAVEQISFVA